MNNDDYLRSAGGAAIGARLRRISEKLDRQATRSYELVNVEFEQRWFNLLNLLFRKGPMSVGDIAGALRITHASVSQARQSLEKTGYITAHVDKSDGRRRELHLTTAGRRLIKKLEPFWIAQAKAASELNEEAGNVTATIDRLEDLLAREDLFERIVRELKRDKT